MRATARLGRPRHKDFGHDAAGARIGAIVTNPTLTGVHVAAGTTDINAVVQANAAGTTFWFDPVPYYPTTIIVPKAGDVFQGQIGTVFDGLGSTAAFAGNVGAGGGGTTTIRNIIFQNFVPTGSSPALAAVTLGTGDTLQDCEVRRCTNGSGTGTGVRLGASATAQRCYIHDCGQYGASAGGNTGLQLLNCEIARNNTAHVSDGSFDAGGTKFASGCSGATVDSCYVHNNGGAGIWFDFNADTVTITNNKVKDNDFCGIDYEICQGPATITGNTLSGNGLYYLAHTAGSTGSIYYGSDISVNTCQGSVGNEIVVANNTVTTNANGIGLIGVDRTPDSANVLTHVYVHDNLVVAGAGATTLAGIVGLSAALADATVRFVNDTYDGPTSSNLWVRNTAMNLAAWRAAAQDTVGGKTAGFETGVNGNNIATGDAGDATAFTTVAIGTNCTVKYDNTHAHSGSLAGKLTQVATASQQAYVQWSAAVMGTLTESYGRFYLWVDTVTATNVVLQVFDTTAATAFQIQLVKTAGQNEHKLKILDGPGTVTAAGAVALALGQWVRVEWHAIANATTGSVVVRLYNSPESATPSETITLTAGNTRANFAQTRHGIVSVNVTWTGWFDDIVAGATFWPGPS
jgi:parallel beta-helix repeat protein